MLKMLRRQLHTRQARQALFFLLFTAVMMVNVVPELRASALDLLDGSDAPAAVLASPVDESRIMRMGFGEEEPLYVPGQKATIVHGGEITYATTRENEDLTTLLLRSGVEVGVLEIVRVTHEDGGVRFDIASDFVLFETETFSIPYSSSTEVNYRVPKGETQLARAGEEGTREVVYEIVYADGQLVSRQAVYEGVTKEPVDELIYTGTLVKSTTRDDRIAQVITEEDGSGYLLLTSGDSMHFTGTKKVTCTAYTANVGKVGTITATGTRVHEGVLAVDKRVIPLGTKMFVVGSSGYSYGYGVAEDTGVLGAWVDCYMDTYRACMNFGLQRNSTVYILDP